MSEAETALAKQRGLLVGVIDKLDQAAFFLERHIRTESDPYPLGHYVSAFAGACYSAWMCLKEGCKTPAELHAWFKDAERTGKVSELTKYFYQGRNEDVHQGTGFVTGARMTLSVRAGRLVWEEEALLRERGSGKYDVKSADIPADCENYLADLAGIVAAGYKLVGSDVDPDGVLCREANRLARKYRKAAR